jgi:hypothetical protein
MEHICLPSLDTSSGSEIVDLGDVSKIIQEHENSIIFMLVSVSSHIFGDVSFNSGLSHIYASLTLPTSTDMVAIL